MILIAVIFFYFRDGLIHNWDGTKQNLRTFQPSMLDHISFGRQTSSSTMRKFFTPIPHASKHK